MKIWTLILCCVISSALKADTVWELKSASEWIKKNNQNYQSQLLELEVASLGVKSARAIYLPELSVNGGINTPLEKDKEDSKSVSAQLSYPIFPSILLNAQLDKSQAVLLEKKATFKKYDAGLRQELSLNLLEYEFYQESERLSAQIVKRRKESAEWIHARFLSGREHKGNDLRSRAQYKSAEAEQNQAKLRIELANEKIKQLLYLPIEGQLRLNVKFSEEKELSPSPDILMLAKNTPEYHQVVARYHSQKADQDLVNNTYLPRVSISASSGKNWQGSENSDSKELSMALSVPLFQGGKGIASRKIAALSTQQAKYQIEETVREKYISLKQAYTAAVIAETFFNVQKEVVEAAKTRAVIARAQYQSGLISYDSWDIIETDAISQERTLLNRERELKAAYIDYEYEMGVGL